MPETTTYAPGTPTWIELRTSDLAGSVRFYSTLFGWDAEDQGEQMGHYHLMRLRGRNVAAIAGAPEGIPTGWATYLATEDVDETTRRVRSAGGTVVAEPMSVADAGRLAAYIDPTGAAVSAWQAGTHTGSELVNEPNTWLWSDLFTRDLERARSFYREAFDIDSRAAEGPMEYTLISVRGRDVGGMMAASEHDVPADVPPHWNVYFAVDDVDATVRRVEELGGHTVIAPSDIPGVGRFASVVDPQGSQFLLMRGDPQQS